MEGGREEVFLRLGGCRRGMEGGRERLAPSGKHSLTFFLSV